MFFRPEFSFTTSEGGGGAFFYAENCCEFFGRLLFPKLLDLPLDFFFESVFLVENKVPAKKNLLDIFGFFQPLPPPGEPFHPGFFLSI